VQGLLKGGCRPGTLLIRGPRLEPVLGPLCAALGIQLRAAASLPALEAVALQLRQHLEAS
jgi:hypothetical protein